MATRGSYVYNYGRIFGGLPKIFVLCNFLRKLMVSVKKIHRAFGTHTYSINKTHVAEHL